MAQVIVLNEKTGNHQAFFDYNPNDEIFFTHYYVLFDADGKVIDYKESDEFDKSLAEGRRLFAGFESVVNIHRKGDEPNDEYDFITDGILTGIDESMYEDWINGGGSSDDYKELKLNFLRAETSETTLTELFEKYFNEFPE